MPEAELRAVISKQISRRAEGIGANGVIFLSADPEYTVELHHYNYAGIDRISYDAYICASKFIFDYGIEGSSEITFITGNTVITVESIDSLTFRISTGVPSVGKEEKLHINDRLYTYTPVFFHFPGASFFFFHKTREEKKEIAELLNTGSTDEHGMRTVFISIYSNDEIEIEPVFRRSVRDMAFAAAVAGTSAVTNNYCDNEIIINCRGSELFFQWKGQREKVFITGKPEYVFRGTYYFDESDY